MYCVYCGSQINEQSKFCGSCGKPVPNSQQVLKPEAAPKVPFPEQNSRRPAPQPVNPEADLDQLDPELQEPKTNRLWILLVVIILVVCLLAGAAIFLVTRDNSKAKDTASDSSAASAASAWTEETAESTAAPTASQTPATVQTTEAPQVSADSAAETAEAAGDGSTAADGSANLQTADTNPAADAGADAQAQPAEEESYYTYINRELLPQYGYASTETTSRDISFDTLTTDCYWDDRSGIISAGIADMDANGTDDLVLLRFDKNNTDDQGRAVLTLNADLYTRDAAGQIYLAGSCAILQCASYDRMEYRCSLVAKDSGYFLMVQSIYWPQGQMRIFAIGDTNVLELYSFDGAVWGKQSGIYADTAGDTPYNLVSGDSQQGFATYAEAMQAAGIPLYNGTATEPYFDGEINSTLLMEYVMSSSTTTMASEATINADLTDYTALKERIDALPE